MHTQKIVVIINMGHRQAVATIKNHKKAGKLKKLFFYSMSKYLLQQVQVV